MCHTPDDVIALPRWLACLAACLPPGRQTGEKMLVAGNRRIRAHFEILIQITPRFRVQRDSSKLFTLAGTDNKCARAWLDVSIIYHQRAQLPCPDARVGQQRHNRCVQWAARMLCLAQQPVEPAPRPQEEGVGAFQGFRRCLGLLDALDAGNGISLEDAGNHCPPAERRERGSTCGGQAALRLVVAGLVLRTLDRCLR